MPISDTYIGNNAVYPGGTGQQIAKVVLPLGTEVTTATATKRFTATVSPTFNLVLVAGDKVQVAGGLDDGIYTVASTTTTYFQVVEAFGNNGTFNTITITRLRRQP